MGLGEGACNITAHVKWGAQCQGPGNARQGQPWAPCEIRPGSTLRRVATEARGVGYSSWERGRDRQGSSGWRLKWVGPQARGPLKWHSAMITRTFDNWQGLGPCQSGLRPSVGHTGHPPPQQPWLRPHSHTPLSPFHMSLKEWKQASVQAKSQMQLHGVLCVPHGSQEVPRSSGSYCGLAVPQSPSIHRASLRVREATSRREPTVPQGLREQPVSSALGGRRGRYPVAFPARGAETQRG